MNRLSITLSAVLLAVTPVVWADQASDIRTLQQLQADANLAAAGQAAARLQMESSPTLEQVLSSMKDATPFGKNWLSAIASAKLSQLDATDAATSDRLVAFVTDRNGDGESRTLVFRYLQRNAPEKAEKLLATMADDPADELRFAAIAKRIEQLPAEGAEPKQLEALLAVARHPDQIRELVKRLTKAGGSIDQAAHFGFIKGWKLIGPFDNRGEAHFDTVYPIEKDLLSGQLPLDRQYVGKSDQQVGWIEHHTTEDEGKVDLAELFNKEKGAAVYAVTIVRSDRRQPAQLRLTSINANKAWVNGELVLSNNVYHSGTRLDQYVGDTVLNQGDNVVVLKVLQNEQTEGWAQDYQFHIRFTTPQGDPLRLPSSL